MYSIKCCELNSSVIHTSLLSSLTRVFLLPFPCYLSISYRHSFLLFLLFTFSRLSLDSFSGLNFSFSHCYHRDPSQHASLRSEIENQSTAYYSTARLWDDGIIRPTDTRDILGLGLGVVTRERILRNGLLGGSATGIGDNKGFGVFRMWLSTCTMERNLAWVILIITTATNGDHIRYMKDWRPSIL